MAYSKAAKRRLKKGRPVLPDVEREPNGRKSRRKVAVMRRTRETEAEIKQVAVSARMKSGLSKSLAERQEAGSVLGRLHLFYPDLITQAHYQAGLRYGADHARYFALLGYPALTARAGSIGEIRGEATDRPEAAARARDKMAGIGEAIRKVDHAGRPVATVLRNVCVMDEDNGMHLQHMVKFLAKGLNELIDFYGIERGHDYYA